MRGRRFLLFRFNRAGQRKQFGRDDRGEFEPFRRLRRASVGVLGELFKFGLDRRDDRRRGRPGYRDAHLAAAD